MTCLSSYLPISELHSVAVPFQAILFISKPTFCNVRASFQKCHCKQHKGKMLCNPKNNFTFTFKKTIYQQFHSIAGHDYNGPTPSTFM